MIQQSYYKDYMSSEENSPEKDLRLILNFFKREFEDVEEVENLIEEMSAYWNNDLGFALMSIILTLGNLRSNQQEELSLLPMFYDKGDRGFAGELLCRSMAHFKEYTRMAQQFVQNWESDRIACADMALIVMGIAEAVYFPGIPIKVTINEYVEISKYYSTRNSHVFVNGVLDKILQNLLSGGAIQKTGRGLIQESINKKIKS